MTDRARAFQDLIEEATTYYVRLQGAPKSRRYRKALLNWIAQSDDHAKAMDLVCRLWGASKAIALPHAADPPRRTPSPVRPFGYLLAGGVGAMAVGLCALLFTANVQHAYSTESYKTADITLGDGTIIFIGPRTSIDIEESIFNRSIRLKQGVADIKVRHSLRGLRTYLRDLQVKDIGTHFVISNYSDRASVTLISGAIAILDPRTGRELSRLTPGGMITWASLGDLRKTTPRDSYPSVAWEDHVIEFDNTPLAEAVRRLHDFTGVNVKLRGRGAYNINISGTFSYDKPGVFFQSLRSIYDVDVTQIDPNSYVIKKQ